MTRVYRPNRRRALVTSALITLSAALFGLALLASGLSRATLGAMLVSQEIDAYEAAVWSMPAGQDMTFPVVAIGALAMAFAGVTFFLWLTRSWTNVEALPVQDARPQSGNADVGYLVLFPALIVAFFVVRSAYPSATATHVALFVAATASLAGPLVVIRRLWIASSVRVSTALAPPVWTGVLVWWAAFGGAWIIQGLTMTVLAQRWDYSRFAERGIQMLAAGFLEISMAVALLVASVFIIRIMFRINAMQNGLARELPEPRPRLERRGAPNEARAAAQWQCESCDVMNPTALRFCQNCARERG